MKKYLALGVIVGAALLSAGCGTTRQGNGQNVVMTRPSNQRPAHSNSVATDEVIRLAQLGVNEDVLVSWATESMSRFRLSERTIAYLRDLGVSHRVIEAMIERDAELPTDLSSPSRAEADPSLAAAGQSSATYKVTDLSR
jgi:hypothetical protein